MISDINVV